jgi:hypothetical protein
VVRLLARHRDRNYNATAAVYQKVVTLENKLAENPVRGNHRKK